MSLKSIRSSYSKLLETFSDAGIKLTESQKNDIDSFVLALESNISEQRKTAIRLTKKAVEDKLEKEFRTVFESIMENTAKHFELASKIQDKITQLNESKKIAGKVDEYLNLYVESVLPKKTIVDYDKMKKLEAIHESLRNSLAMTDDVVVAKKEELERSFKLQKSKLETEVAKMQVKLNESLEKNSQLTKKLDQYKASQLLESKTKDLPIFEARKVKKALADSSAPDIEKKFNKVLEDIQKDEKIAASECETAIENEINDIVKEDDVAENDMLNGRTHNNHVDETDVDEKDDDFETTETITLDPNGDVELDDDDVIDKDTINEMCQLCESLYK